MAVSSAAKLLICLGLLQRSGSAPAFPCSPTLPAKTSPTNATDVHPAHVSVVMAMGDSITAAFAAGAGLAPYLQTAAPKSEKTQKVGANVSLNVTAAPVEHRDRSFSGGKGDDSQVTLPYFLSHYNQTLTGWSTGWAWPQFPSKGDSSDYKYPSQDAMNAALSNAHSWQLSQQVDQLKSYSSNIPDFQDRWKVLTLFIGANDLCDGGDGNPHEACDGNATHANTVVTRYESWLRDALEKLRDSMSRIVIQLVSLLSFASVHPVRQTHWWCRTVHSAGNECNCLDRPAPGRSAVNDEQLANFDETTDKFNEVIQRLSLEFNLQRPDFAVVNAVGIKGQAIPSATYLSNLDCFHPSAKAHTVFAKTLWNSMFDTTRATAPISDNMTLYCPTADDVIFVGKPAKPAHRAETVVV